MEAPSAHHHHQQRHDSVPHHHDSCNDLKSSKQKKERGRLGGPRRSSSPPPFPADLTELEEDKEHFEVKKQQVIKKNFERMNKRIRSVFKFSRSYYAQYMRYRFLKLRWINNCVVNFM